MLLLQRLSQLRCRAVGSLLELRRLVARLARQRHLRLNDLLRSRQFICQGLLPGDRRADRTNASGIVLTGGSLHIGGELGAEIQADERRRDQGCGDRGDCKPAPRGRSVLRFVQRGRRLEPGDSDRVRLRNLTKSNDIIRRRRPLWRSPARGERKEAGLSRRRGAARSRFSLQKKFIRNLFSLQKKFIRNFLKRFIAFLQKMFIAPRCMPMRRRDLA